MESEQIKSKRKYVKKPKPIKPNEPINKPVNKNIIVKFGF